MNLKKKISLEKIRNDRKNPIFDFDMKDAVITHFLHNNKNDVSQFYKSDAVAYTNEIYKEYINSEVENIVCEDSFQYELFAQENIPFEAPENPKFKFIDLFAGIGGFRLALQNLGGKCVFTSEWDKQAQKTYRTNFGETPFGDITKELTKSYIPDRFDILCAGFPCQAFSIAGKRGGFEDTRGTLFFEVAEIIKRKKPKAIFLENVKVNICLGVPYGRAFRSNLFVPSSQKGFQLQSLTQNAA